MMTFLAIPITLLVASLTLVGLGIGVFYQRKFGERTNGWLFLVGAGLGVLGQILSNIPGLHAMVGGLVLLTGAIFLAAGTFWLWFVMMGPRK